MKKRYIWYALVGVLWIVALYSTRDRCERAFMTLGIETRVCPVGAVRQTARLQIRGLRRGAPGAVSLTAVGHFTTGPVDAAMEASEYWYSSVALAVVDAHGTATPIEHERARVVHGEWTASVTLPDSLPDGDYKLRAAYATRLGSGTLESPLPLYTPARIHVITDRPLYEPGNLVKFRAVVLRARDLAPIDGRPGRWIVTDANGDVMLEEQAPAGDWGVVSGSFPLDKGAPTGRWRVAWQSADATDEVPFSVEPFTLPRFRVEAAADKPFYGVGAQPIVRGAVTYSSGAPVAHASIELTWSADGEWPPPREWDETLLPKRVTAEANGRFELKLPTIPDDLLGHASLTAHLAAVDPAGDRVESSVTVLLAKDGIDASAVTELGNGLVAGFNNRLYIRVTTPDGQVLANTKIHVRRAWQPNDNGFDAMLDEDGVASLQLDPGAPVNVVIPPQPWRPASRPPLVTRTAAADLVGNEGLALADQVELDKWLPSLAPCAKWAGDDDESRTARIGLRFDAAGTVLVAGAGPGPLEQCVVSAVRAKRLPAGTERLYSLAFTFSDPDLPKLAPAIEAPLGQPSELPAALATWVRGARDCLPDAADGHLPAMLAWRLRAGSKEVELGAWLADPKAAIAASARPIADAAQACVQSRIGQHIALKEAAASDSLGLVRFTVTPTERMAAHKPQATTMLGYELAVTAAAPGSPTTLLRVSPGEVPNLRMRVTPVLAKAGDPITAELIRGPEFRAKLPEKLAMDCLKVHATALLGEDHAAHFQIAAGVEGWCDVTGGGVHGLVYVQPAATLAVTIAPKQDRYAPGQMAELLIRTRLGGKGGKAAVGLVGVDASLGQLTALPGADDLARVRPHVETSDPAFGTLDGQALALGRIRGANAAAATVLRVSGIPSPPELDAVVNTQSESHFDPVEELTDHFYAVLAEVHAQARAWEAKAPASEKMRPATMARLWRDALAACERRGERTDDAYGRSLRLSLLPPDLLALVDPRAVVVIGTRLPEDIENWAAWVQKEKP